MSIPPARVENIVEKAEFIDDCLDIPSKKDVI